MEYTTIPSLSSKVSRIGLGTWAIGGWLCGGTEEKAAIATIQEAMDLGINLIDTAPVYGFGVSETIVGKALKKYKTRDAYFIATKAGLNWKEENVFREAHKSRIYKEIEDSLKRLQVDYIDLYQIHWPDPKTPFLETAEAMHDLWKQGKIRSIGVCNYTIPMIEAFQQAAPIHVLQSPFNLFEREIEHSELPFTLEKGIATLGYGPLCRGLLSGRMHRETTFAKGDLRNTDPKFNLPQYLEYLQCVKKLDDWTKSKYQHSVLSLAVRWVLDKKVSVALWGARKPQQLDSLKTIFGWSLTNKDFEEIDQIIQQTVSQNIGAEFMAPQ